MIGRYLLAVVVTLVLFVVFAVIGGLLGWKHGGGMIPMLLFFASTWFAWKKIVGSGKKPE